MYSPCHCDSIGSYRSSVSMGPTGHVKIYIFQQKLSHFPSKYDRENPYAGQGYAGFNKGLS